MRKILLLSICIVVFQIKAQLNLVNDGYFNNTGIVEPINGPAMVYPGMNYWYPRLSAGGQVQVYVNPDDSRNDRNYLGLKNLQGTSWHTSFAQRVAVPDHGIYRLGFWAKFTDSETSDVFLRVFLRINTTQPGSKFFRRINDGDIDDVTKNRVERDQFVTRSWKYYTVDFDLSKTASDDKKIFENAEPADIQDFSVSFSNFNGTKKSDIQVTGVTLKKVEVPNLPKTWYNPGFEEAYAVPFAIEGNDGKPTFATVDNAKGVWNLMLHDGINDPGKSRATVWIDSVEFHSGKRSMKLNVKKVVNSSKVCLVTSLFNLPKGDYEFSFYAKTNLPNVPFRVDVDNFRPDVHPHARSNPYGGTASIRKDQISNTQWTKYTVAFNNTLMSDTLAIAICPNIGPSGTPESWGGTPVTYWFDDFSMVFLTGTYPGGDGNVSVLDCPWADQYPPVFYSYEKAGNGKYKVYVHIKDSLYALFNIVHEVKANHHKNLWRIADSYFAVYSNERMLQSTQILTSGENEFVWLSARPGVVEFTGGYHGNERIDLNENCYARFYSDGRLIESGESLQLIPCSEFYYEQLSNMYQTGTGGSITSPNYVPVPNAPVECVHEKKTVFGNKGYETFNKVTWAENITPVKRMYYGLFSVGNDVAKKGYVDDDSQSPEIVEFVSDNQFKLKTSGQKIVMFNDLSKVYVKCDSRVIKGGSFSLNASVWDTSIYKKYYSAIQNDNPIITSDGEIWETNASVIFDIIENPMTIIQNVQEKKDHKLKAYYEAGRGIVVQNADDVVYLFDSQGRLMSKKMPFNKSVLVFPIDYQGVYIIKMNGERLKVHI